MRCEQVRESLVEFLGEPGEAVPDGTREHLEGCADCRDELDRMQETWATLGLMEEEPSSERMRARFYAMLAGETAGDRQHRLATATIGEAGGFFSWWTRRPALQVGLLMATLVAGVLVGTWIGSRQKRFDEIDELRAEMRSMTHMVTISLLGHQSASERLRAIGFCEATPPDDELVSALLGVVKDDPSANVRLAALDVLASMPARPDVIAGLIESFPHQTAPPVTAAMASLLLKVDGKDAVTAVRAAAADEKLPDTVRQYLLRLLADSNKAKGTGT